MKKMIGRISKVFIPAVISLFFYSSIASAHVTVMPKTSSTGAWETYTLKVPVEKDVATTKVTVKVPAGVEMMSYQPVPGWTYSSEKDASGKVKTFTFEATGEGIQSGQFQQFVFVAKNPEKATKAAWDAFQYYKDGSIVEWTGNEGSDAPHSITDIVTATTTDHHDSQTTDHNDKAQTKDTKKTEGKDTEKKLETSNSLSLVLSGLAALLSFAALIIAIRKK
ncbi:YcnI family copper-binding membrane protein [Bacillaceae bacterium C204]|uniref:YcnI family copper-binding membrane protein n=1 Tax=Neobacillus sp. 204 TaxID=3383351 RepID=UPI003978A0C0